MFRMNGMSRAQGCARATKHILCRSILGFGPGHPLDREPVERVAWAMSRQSPHGRACGVS